MEESVVESPNAAHVPASVIAASSSPDSFASSSASAAETGHDDIVNSVEDDVEMTSVSEASAAAYLDVLS